MDKIARGFINIIHYVDAYALLCLSLLLEHRAGTGAGGRPGTGLHTLPKYQFGGWLVPGLEGDCLPVWRLAKYRLRAR